MTETLGEHADELKALRERYVPRGVTTAHPLVADHALGSEVWDSSGRRYVDFVGGIGVMNVGHNHPRVMAAVRDQLGITATVEVLARDTLPRSGYKVSRVVDA